MPICLYKFIFTSKIWRECGTECAAVMNLFIYLFLLAGKKTRQQHFTENSGVQIISNTLMRGVKSGEVAGESDVNFPVWAHSEARVPLLRQDQLQLTPLTLNSRARTFSFQIHLVSKTGWVWMNQLHGCAKNARRRRWRRRRRRREAQWWRQICVHIKEDD